MSATHPSCFGTSRRLTNKSSFSPTYVVSSKWRYSAGLLTKCLYDINNNCNREEVSGGGIKETMRQHPRRQIRLSPGSYYWILQNSPVTLSYSPFFIVTTHRELEIIHYFRIACCRTTLAAEPLAVPTRDRCPFTEIELVDGCGCKGVAGPGGPLPEPSGCCRGGSEESIGCRRCSNPGDATLERCCCCSC